jgi:hypothetical protein
VRGGGCSGCTFGCGSWWHIVGGGEKKKFAVGGESGQMEGIWWIDCVDRSVITQSVREEEVFDVYTVGSDYVLPTCLPSEDLSLLSALGKIGDLQRPIRMC